MGEFVPMVLRPSTPPGLCQRVHSNRLFESCDERYANSLHKGPMAMGQVQHITVESALRPAFCFEVKEIIGS